MKRFLLAFLLTSCMSFEAKAFQNPLALDLGNHTFILPFKSVEATQLFSFKRGVGLTGLQTVLYSYQNKVHADFGGADLLSVGKVYPFGAVQFLLPKSIFDPSAGPIWLGAWAGGKSFKGRDILFGLDASLVLW